MRLGIIYACLAPVRGAVAYHTTMMKIIHFSRHINNNVHCKGTPSHLFVLIRYGMVWYHTTAIW